MRLDADVIILGGGCSGLSLAVALAERAPSLRVTTLESRSHYSRDRTWCFWNTETHPFSAGVTHRWHSWRVRRNGEEARQYSRCYSYQHLPGDRFYDLAVQRIHDAGQQLSLAVKVSSIRQVANACEVETSQGRLGCKWVFDSRQHNPGELRPVLEQRFTGWHVKTERPCFDPNVVDLMDFQPFTEQGRTAFFYVLPFCSTEALVEVTFFDDPRLAPANAESMLCRFMQERSCAGYQVLYREAASLPMGEHRSQAPSSGSIVDIGRRGGRLKASSGYAFLRIQRQSAAFADALSRQMPLPHSVEPSFYGLLDRIFLRALQQAPSRAASYFMAMFRKLPPDILVRFLSETASPVEVLRVMLSLPKFDFIQAALLTRASEKLA